MLRLGLAGEHFAAYDLSMQGFRVAFAPAGAPYDLLVDTGAKRLRVQVRANARWPSSVGRSHDVIRVDCMSGKRRKTRTRDHCDVVAFVFLRFKTVQYVRASEINRAVEWRRAPLKADARGRRVGRPTRYIIGQFSRFPRT